MPPAAIGVRSTTPRFGAVVARVHDPLTNPAFWGTSTRHQLVPFAGGVGTC